LIIPIDLTPLKATMPTTTPTILDQISAEKAKVSERLARLDTDRATVATQLTEGRLATQLGPHGARQLWPLTPFHRSKSPKIPAQMVISFGHL
jgi:hypothetical protein